LKSILNLHIFQIKKEYEGYFKISKQRFVAFVWFVVKIK
jgi:hypothetical protein